MKNPITYNNIHNYLVSALFKKKLVTNLHAPNQIKLGHALLYYKTDPFTWFYRHNHIHTNIWEISCLVKILNQFGYWVDVIDRSIDYKFLPSNKYDLFIGIGSDDSGQHFTKYAKQLTKATKILLTTSSHPAIRNSKIQQRADELQQRQGQTLPQHRRIKKTNIDQALNIADYIFCIGNQQTIQTFAPHTKRSIFRLNPSTAPNLTTNANNLFRSQANHFLFLGGAGNLLKGVDLLIETFSQLPDCHLHLCTVMEPETMKLYRSILSRSPNIHLEGFIMMNSKRFDYLTRVCPYVISLSCSEGLSTSVTSCMRRALIPVVTPESGIDIGNFGHHVTSLKIKKLHHLFNDLAHIQPDKIHQQRLRSYLDSFQYTQDAFAKNLISLMLQLSLT